jgi:putative PIN family toxin of toxin-antitoxin system
MKVVIDTNVVVSAFRSRSGAAFRVIELWGDKRFEPIISAPLVFEYESVLLRHSAELGLTARDVGDALDYLCAIAQHQAIYYLWRPVLRDPGDDLVLEVAVAGSAECIITHNLKDFGETKRFGIRAVTPAGFLRMIGEKHEHD